MASFPAKFTIITWVNSMVVLRNTGTYLKALIVMLIPMPSRQAMEDSDADLSCLPQSKHGYSKILRELRQPVSATE
jgi:hypothetical protein